MLNYHRGFVILRFGNPGFENGQQESPREAKVNGD
jgi:hypothetical protein